MWIPSTTATPLLHAEAFNADNEIYSVAAPALLELIEKVRANGIDVTEALAVYDDDNATLEEINTQITALNELLIAYATPNNPVDVTDKYIVNATPTANSDGWTITGRATFDSNNNCAEFWNVSGASIKQTLFGLPAGSYKLSAVAFTRSDMTAALSANENTVNLVTVGSEVVNSRAQAASWFNEGNGLNELIFGLAESADVEIGLTADTNSGDHWMLWRNFKLEYLGNNGGEIIIPSDTIDIQPCTMMGSVMSADGEALAGTKVIVKNEEGMVVATTTVNANGYYIVEGLTEGIYVVEITYPGYVSVTMQFMAIAGESVSQNITLVKEPEIIQPCTIMGSVMSADGRALAGTKVIVKNEEGMVVATTTVNANGYYVVEDLPEGMYEVEVTCPGYVSVTMQFMAIAGESVSQSITLVKESVIIVEGERQKPEIYDYPATFAADHGFYIYNMATDKYLSMGEAWSTQSCVVDFENDASGNKPFVYQFKNDVQENTTLPEGTYYLWSADAVKGKGWIARINTDSKTGKTNTCFSDGNASHFSALKTNWKITDQGEGIYLITVPEDDPNGMYLDGCALGVDPEHYSAFTTPTYALYWDIPAEDPGCQWMLFDADAYNVANEIYSVAAPELLALIQRVQEKGIDVTEAQTIYNNVNATLDEINEQIVILRNILEGYATAKVPVDVTEKYIVNPEPYQNIDGWTAPKGMPNSLDAGNKCAEFWSYSGYSIEQTLTLPAGLYKLTAIACSREGQHGFLSAGDYQVELAHVASSVVNNRTQANTWFNEGNGVNELYFPMTENGEITIALTTDATTGDHWTLWRSFQLEYLGNDLEASYKDAIRMSIPEDWADEFATGVTYTQSYYNAVNAAIASVDNIATVAEAVAELTNPAPAAAIQTLRENVAAWDAFSVWYDNMQTTFYSTPIADGLGSMGDYVGLYNDATDMEDWLLDIAAVWDGYAKALAPVAEEITTEMLTTDGTVWFDSLYRATVYEIYPEEIQTPIDITDKFLENPDFYSDGGTLNKWTVLTGAYGNNGRSYGYPVWYNDFHRVMERWNGDFNIYQDITLPKTGAYRVSTWGWYRTADNQTVGAANSAWAIWNAADGKSEGANTICAFFYADQLQKAFPNICNRTYTREEIDAIGADYDYEVALKRSSRGGFCNEYPYDFLLVEGTDEDGIFIPNGVYAADYLFTHPQYNDSYKIEFSFVGQERQSLRLGIKAENVGVPAGDIGWTVFDQIHLIYEGPDPEIIAKPLAALIDQAETLMGKTNSEEIRKVLSAAIREGQNAIATQDGDAMLAAYTQLNDAIAFATENMVDNSALIAAKDKLDEAIQTYGDKASDTTLEEAVALQQEIEAMLADGISDIDSISYYVEKVNSMVSCLMEVLFDIYVDVPGTLGEKVMAEAGEYSNVRNIKVSGSLNENDMECFREMNNIVTVDLSETDVTRIEDEIFCYHENLTKAVLPKNLEYMGWGVFYDCYNLTNIVCPVAEPAYVDGEIMGGNERKCTLTVPSISVAFYQKASYWNRFKIAASDILPEDINVSHGTYTLNLPETIPATYKPNVWLGTTNIWGEHRYGGLEVNGNSTLSMNNFAITYDPNIDREYNSGWYERPNHQTVTYGTLVNNANLRADNVTVQMWTKTNEWTFFSVPFDVKVSSIRKEFGETPYVIRKYDGVKRAASDMDNTWVDMTADSTLVAGQGYILQSPSYNGRYYDGFSFDAIQNTNKNNIFANNNVDVQLAEYVSEFPQNRSWNLIGNPYPCFFDTRAIDVTAPVIVWNAYNSNYEAYSPVDDQLILKPGEAFFMQRPVDQASITFLKEGRQNNLVIRDVNYFGHARQSDMKEERNVFNLTLSDGERGDHTRFVINNSAKMSYEEGCDASKFMSLDWKANQLYTIQSGVRYAINERPMDNGVIELGLMIGTEGMLTIALETNVKNEVFLIDRQNNTEVRIDGTTGYEFFAEVGTIEGRFAIRLGDGSVTGINSVFGSDKDNNEYYDLRGVRIQQPRKGLYIQNGKKVVIK